MPEKAEMKRFYIDDVPDGLRNSFLEGRAFTVFDTEDEKIIGYVDVLDFEVRVHDSEGHTYTFDRVGSALQS